MINVFQLKINLVQYKATLGKKNSVTPITLFDLRNQNENFGFYLNSNYDF